MTLRIRDIFGGVGGSPASMTYALSHTRLQGLTVWQFDGCPMGGPRFVAAANG